jgi:hypothetical protein
MAMRMMNGSMNDRELSHQDQVDHQHRNDEPQSELRERAVHADNGAAQVQNRILVGLRVCQQFVDPASYPLQRFSFVAT